MADREYIVMFTDDRARIRLAQGEPIGARKGKYRASETRFFGENGQYPYVNTSTLDLHPPEYHVSAPSAQRAEQIARVMKGAEK